LSKLQDLNRNKS